MRGSWLWLMLAVCAAAGCCAQAASGQVIKVLPQYLDLQGRHALSPSLYDRDAYQAFLRDHPEKRSGMRFNVQWKTRGSGFGPLKLRLELRGIALGDLPRQMVVDAPVSPTGWFGRWTGLNLAGKEYKNFGEVTAWRVTLLEEGKVLSEEKSFLW